MSHDITRRDFLDGVALAIAATAIPGSVSLAQSARPPALTGLRGSHDGAFEVAHRLALQGETFSIDPLPVEESYDLVVVGAGVSGLAAAHFYRRRFGRRTRILILDNHDDVGGHAKRNEFMVGGRLLLSYGGSESLQSPKAYFSDAVKGLMAELGVTVDRFETFFDRKLYGSLGLQRATFFDAATFGADRLVTGDPTVWVSDDTVPGQRPERPIEDFIADFPMSIEARRQLLVLHTEPRRILPDLAEEGREAKLKRMSYPDFLKVQWGVGDEALQYFRQRTHDYFGLPPTFVSAYDAWHAGYPGFQGLGGEPDASVTEPYIYHFPDGNASVVRLLVRRLVPRAIPGSTMEDIILAPLAYDRLDRPENSVRIRLSSTVVRAQNRK